MIEILAQVEAPDTPNRKGFSAGLVLHDNKVVEAADVVRFMRGWMRDRVRDYCKGRGWKTSIVKLRQR